MKIGILNGGMSNIKSVYRAFEVVGGNPIIVEPETSSRNFDVLVIPGVGTFESGMRALNVSCLINKICEHNMSGRPLLGICLGMQILFQRSEESTGVSGLSFLPGVVKSIGHMMTGREFGVPNIGYNYVNSHAQNESFLSKSLSGYYYFMHSYAIEAPPQDLDIYGVTEFNGKKYLSFLMKNNLCGIQFHPEKSGKKGLFLLKNIIEFYQKY
jgi:glutamine amidotransferase